VSCLYSSCNRPQLDVVREPREGRGERTVGFDAQDENDEVEAEDDEAEEERDDDDDVESDYSDQGNEDSFIRSHSNAEVLPRPPLDPERLAALAHADLPSELYAQLSEILAWHDGVQQARRLSSSWCCCLVQYGDFSSVLLLSLAAPRAALPRSRKAYWGKVSAIRATSELQ
jgi:hypothetical protein